MMTRHYLSALLVFVVLPCLAEDKGADPTQSFVSPLGLGTGATLAVTQKGTDVTAAVERQLINSGVNFWQVGLSGTTDKNGQAPVFSSHDADAPGFKAKIGLGRSSFIALRPVYTAGAAEFLLQAWCRDLLKVVDKTLPVAAGISKNTSCQQAVALGKTALSASPPVDEAGKPDQKAKDLDTLVLTLLEGVAGDLTLSKRANICDILKNESRFYQFCPDSGKPQKSLTDQQAAYPGLGPTTIAGQPSKFQWKIWASWAPTLTSVSYRPITGGVADLSNKQNWTKLLNAGAGDVALYYGSLAFGVEGGYGQTVQIKTQNICNNTTSGTFTAQQCDTAMVGKPTPTNAKMISATLQVTPLPILGKGATVNPGAQVVFSYCAPDSGGHSSELALPFYLAPSVSPMSFVLGIQPTWDWNTDPKVGNKFSVSLFVGARPSLSK